MISHRLPFKYFTPHVLQRFVWTTTGYSDRTMGFTTKKIVVWIPAGAIYFSVLQHVQTGSRAHPDSSLVVPRGRSPFLNGPESKPDHSPPSSAEFKSERSCTSTPQHVLLACTGTVLLPLFSIPLHSPLYLASLYANLNFGNQTISRLDIKFAA